MLERLSQRELEYLSIGLVRLDHRASQTEAQRAHCGNPGQTYTHRAGHIAEVDIAAITRLCWAIGVVHITYVPEHRGTQRALILDERHGEQHFQAPLDEYVTTDRQRILIRVGDGAWARPVTRRATRAEAAILEAAYRIEAAGIVDR